MPAEDEAESTTKATVSEGEIEIRDKENQKQDLAGLNRDTQNALNKLGEIFDKDSIEERQELAGLFGELAYNQIHFMEGTDEQKAAYHALVGGIMAELTNGNFLAGASAAAVNKLVVEEINKIADGDPAMAQWLSAALGVVITGDKSGASIAASGTKNNFYHLFMKKAIDSINPDLLEYNEAYAIMIDLGYEMGGVSVGCFLARDPDNPDDLIIFDNTGLQLNLSLSDFSKLSLGSSITTVIFDENVVAADALDGIDFNVGVDFNNVHYGKSWSITDIVNNTVAMTNQEPTTSVETGVSSETIAAIQVGISKASEVGNRSDDSIWNPITHPNKVAIENYILYNSDKNYTIYKNKITNTLTLIKKTENGYKMLATYGDNQYDWLSIRESALPTDRDYQIIQLRG